MPQTVSITLPEALYERVCETAASMARSVQEVLAESIALSLPALEKELPPEIRAVLGPMALLSDEELGQLSRETLDHARQSRLEELAEHQKTRSLLEAERAELDDLIGQAQRIMLVRAEARRLLALRGYQLPAGSFSD